MYVSRGQSECNNLEHLRLHSASGLFAKHDRNNDGSFLIMIGNRLRLCATPSGMGITRTTVSHIGRHASPYVHDTAHNQCLDFSSFHPGLIRTFYSNLDDSGRVYSLHSRTNAARVFHQNSDHDGSRRNGRWNVAGQQLKR